MADQTTTKPADLIYEDTGAMAPLVYFDIVGAYGTMNGAVEVELATRILVPKLDGTTEVKFISSGRIRCTQNAAINLRNGLDAALKMLEQPQANTVAVAGSKLNCSRPSYSRDVLATRVLGQSDCGDKVACEAAGRPLADIFRLGGAHGAMVQPDLV